MKQRWMTALVITLALTFHARGQELAKPIRVEADGKPINIGGVGHSAPAVADFYGDGKPHLLVGAFSEGQLRIYRNVGTHQTPRFNSKYDLLLDGKTEGTVPTG
ncbi:MAG: hypothetical protein HYX68_28175 [Planctomycetes bacterium]|nr:hypothetical protein [Planctomycetota bacterium]